MYHNIIPLKEITYKQFLTLARNEPLIETFPDIRKRLFLCIPETNRLCEMSEQMTFDSSSAYRVSPGREERFNPLAEYESNLWNKSQSNPLRVKIRNFVVKILAEEFESFDLVVKIEFLKFVEDCNLYDDKTIEALRRLKKHNKQVDDTNDKNFIITTHYLTARTYVLFSYLDFKHDGGSSYIRPLSAKELIKQSEEVVIEQFTIRMFRQLMCCIVNLCMKKMSKKFRLGKLNL